MRILKPFFGYTWAAIALIIALATFPGQSYFSKVLANATGVVIHPKYSGGEIIWTIDHGNYKTVIHRPVFSDDWRQKKEGFVQVNYEPAGSLPEWIEEGIDYDGDKTDDFIVSLHTVTGETCLSVFHPSVKGIKNVYHLKNGWALRIHLSKNQH